MSSQAQIQAAEKFKAPEVSAITGKEAEEETAAADGGEESEGEEVSLCFSVYFRKAQCHSIVLFFTSPCVI